MTVKLEHCFFRGRLGAGSEQRTFLGMMHLYASILSTSGKRKLGAYFMYEFYGEL